jgi:hypothetical protein
MNSSDIPQGLLKLEQIFEVRQKINSSTERSQRTRMQETQREAKIGKES